MTKLVPAACLGNLLIFIFMLIFFFFVNLFSTLMLTVAEPLNTGCSSYVFS